MPAKEKIPVVVLTGFLGSGKTTLLSDVLSAPALRDTGVVVNEFGEVGLDHDLVRIGVGEREVMLTAGGCICCTTGVDLRASLSDLLEADKRRRVDGAPPMRRVIVETTGIADPAPVVNQIVPGGMPALGLRDHTVARTFTLAGVAATVDALAGAATLEAHPECVRQVAFADRIVLTKTDMAGPDGAEAIARLRDTLADINPAATILDRHDPATRIADLLAPRPYAPADLGGDVESWLAADRAGHRPHEHGDHDHAHGHGHHGVRTVAIETDAPVATADLSNFLDLLHIAAGPRLLRLKGLVRLAEEPERPLVLQVVQHAVHPLARLDAWPSEDRRTRVVAIVRDLSEEFVQDLFRALTGERDDAPAP